jgi:transglutaminase-like putative cysteine protease
MSRRTPRLRATRPSVPTMRISAVIALALLLALGGLRQLLEGAVWWLLCGTVVLVVLAVVAGVRHATRRSLVPSVAGAAALVALLTLVFAADTAILGLVPTPATIGRFAELLSAGSSSIQEQGVPATVVPGIQFILALCAGLVALAADAFAIPGRVPAVTGVPLLAIVAAPGFVDSEYTDPLFFVITAAAWLLLLFVASSRVQPGVAMGIGATAVVAALVVPLMLPPVLPVDDTSSGDGYATGLNPIVDLGNDLRRDAPVTALTYVTTSKDRQYLRMATLEEFGDEAWAPTIGSGDSSADPEDIAPVADRGADIAVVGSSTTISMGNVRGRWLPVPYAPRSVTGLVGAWTWDPETLNVRTERSSVRGQEYTVTTETAAPTSDQLRAAAPALGDDMRRYLELPERLPPSVAETAATVTAGAPTAYDQAMALQSYFRSGAFVYSEDAPVEEGYDGTSAAVIGRFLEEKSGYCVHFASAMAAMARTLGIPSRIAVGFTAGAEVDNPAAGESEYRVTTDDLHAWPELHFAGVGWVRFEPTVGRLVPEYVDAVQDDPTTPDIDESTATPAPTSAAADPLDRPDTGSVASGASAAGPNWNAIILSLAALLVLVALAVPAMVRVRRRRARLRALESSGSTIGAWDEVRDTALDLGWRLTDAETPREFAERLSTSGPLFTATGPIGGLPLTDPDAVAALERLRVAVELESFAAASGRPGAASAAPGGARPDDVRVVVAALRRGVERGPRVRAALAPTSVLVGWFAIGTRGRSAD